MPHFSKESERRLYTCHKDLIVLGQEGIKLYDFVVLEGHRDKHKQNSLFRSGHSQLTWPDSKHNSSPSMAIDLAPYPIDWTDMARWHWFASGILGLYRWLKLKGKVSLDMRWGGDWDRDGMISDNKFNDLGHFELIEEEG